MINKAERIRRLEIRGDQQGDGVVVADALIELTDYPETARMFFLVTLNEGCSIGKHYHNEETEYYYCLSGEGIYDDNGEVVAFRPGDVITCGGKQYHSIRNSIAQPLSL